MFSLNQSFQLTKKYGFPVFINNFSKTIWHFSVIKCFRIKEQKMFAFYQKFINIISYFILKILSAKSLQQDLQI